MSPFIIDGLDPLNDPAIVETELKLRATKVMQTLQNYPSHEADNKTWLQYQSTRLLTEIYGEKGLLAQIEAWNPVVCGLLGVESEQEIEEELLSKTDLHSPLVNKAKGRKLKRELLEKY